MNTTRQAGITWLGHSTFLIDTPGGKRVLVEAFVESNPRCPQPFHGIDDLDLILVTHAHGDHAGDAVALAERSGAPVAGMVELMAWFESQGVAQTIDFNKGGTIHVGGISVTMTDAKHSTSTTDGTYAGEAAGFVITLEDGYRIYHAGDTSVFGDMRIIGELYRPDIAILPIGGHYTMDPVEAAYAVELLGVREVLGMHYGTYPPLKGTPAELRDLVLEGVTVHELQPGEMLSRVAVGTPSA